jgi:hypothetical protein
LSEDQEKPPSEEKKRLLDTDMTRTPIALQADSADVAVSRTLLSKSEPLPSYGAVMPTAGESIL